MNVGDKIKFFSEKAPYTIKAANERFKICTKPFNPQRTILYTIVDLEKNIRGVENLIFKGCDIEAKRGPERMLRNLVRGEIEISHRNFVELDIEKVISKGK